MFEQSILPDYAGGQKTGAFAASLSAQILAAGVLVVVPLFYNDVFPMLRMNTPLSIPLTPYQPPQPVHSQAQAESTRAPMRIPVRVFVAPAPDPTPLVHHTPVEFDGLGIPSLNPTTPVVVVPGIQAPHVIEIAPPPPPPATTQPVNPREAPLTVTSEIQAAKILHKVVPPYPPLAVKARVQGTVHLMGVIAKDGTIQDLKIVSGHPLLVKVAFDAVKQWTYRSTILNNEPVEVIAPIDVIFTLSN